MNSLNENRGFRYGNVSIARVFAEKTTPQPTFSVRKSHKEKKRKVKKKIYLKIYPKSLTPLISGKIQKSMAKKNYKIRAKLVFKGEFKVKAGSREQAEEKIRKQCGCLIGNIQSLDEDVDWEFPMHGEIEINRKIEEAEQC